MGTHGGEHPGRLHRRGVPRNPDRPSGPSGSRTAWPSTCPTGRSWRPCACWAAPRGVRRARGAAGTAGVKKAVELGLIPAGSTVVSIVTGNGLKDVQSGIQAAGEPMRSL
ncbi:MAG: hypothetical protein ACLRIS_12220 [Flavonifractor plautii]